MSRGAILVAGLALAAAGWLGLEQSWRTGDLVAEAARLRIGAETPSPARLETGIRELRAIRNPGANELGALAFFDYAAAEATRSRGDRATAQQQLDEAAAAAREALALSPARADLALVLAEIELLREGAGPKVYEALTLSYRTAPREMWIVKRRIGLGLRLIAVAPHEIADDVMSDVHMLGEPFSDPERYRILAEAAYIAGPAAIATVERELGLGHPWPFGAFEKDLSELRTRRATPAR